MKLILFQGVFLFTIQALTAESDVSSAVAEVQKRLQNKNSRTELLNSPEANKAADSVTGLTGGGANEEEFYLVVNEILNRMKSLSPEQMQKMIKEAQTNPQGFLQSLPPEIREKIKNLSQKVPTGHQSRP